MFGLQFIKIGEELEKIGVKMNIVTPLLNSELLNKQEIDFEALNIVKNNKEIQPDKLNKEEVLKRKNEFLEISKKYNIKNKFGSYS